MVSSVPAWVLVTIAIIVVIVTVHAVLSIVYFNDIRNGICNAVSSNTGTWMTWFSVIGVIALVLVLILTVWMLFARPKEVKTVPTATTATTATIDTGAERKAIKEGVSPEESVRPDVRRVQREALIATET